MPRNGKLSEMKKTILKVVLSSLFDEIKCFVKEAKLSLWGENKPENHLEIMVILSLYKDITGKGYRKVLEEAQLNFHINWKSL